MALGLSCASAFASTFTLDFNTDPSASLNFGGTAWDGVTTANTGGTAWVKDGGVPMGATTNGPQKGVTGNGYLQLTFATLPGGSAVDQGFTTYLVGGVLFTNFDGALVVSGFTLDCDMRIGNGTASPADGFSINYVRINDPALIALQNGLTFPDMNNKNAAVTGTMTVPGAFSDNGSSGDVSLAEEGMQTGLSVGFDLWDSGNYVIPPTGVGKVAPGLTHDSIGMDIRVDDVLLTTISMPNGTTQTQYDVHGNALTASDPNGNNAATDPTAIETGPNDGTGSPDTLSWVHLKVDQAPTGLLNVYWKNVQILTNFQTSFSPSAGRLLMAARVGGSTANIDVDNIQIVTIPSALAIIGNATGTAIGFTIAASDSGPSVVNTNTLSLKLNGTTVTPTSVTSAAGLTSISFKDATKPSPPGTTNTVTLSFKDAQGTLIGPSDRTYVVPAYTTIPATYAVTGVDTTKPGFVNRIYQVDTQTDPQVNLAEAILHGNAGANTADLSQYTGTGKTFAEANVINYNALSGNIGDYIDDGTVANSGVASPDFPGLPGSAARESGTDDAAMEILTYIQFPAPGLYQLICNSDDGFRMQIGQGDASRDQLNSLIVSQADVGRGATDTAVTVYVPQAGFYAARLLWFQGGGGANVEWSAVSDNGPIGADGTRALLNDSTTTGSLKTYRARTGDTPPVVTFLTPVRSASGSQNVLPSNIIDLEITDGSTAQVTGAVGLTVNGVTVTPTTSKSGSVTKVTYTPPGGYWPSGATITNVLTFADSGTPSVTRTDTWTFTVVQWATLPGSLALPASAVNTANPGFLIKTHQMEIVRIDAAKDLDNPQNTTEVGEYLVRGLFGWPNLANLTSFTGPSGYYVEKTSINYNGGQWSATGGADGTGGIVGGNTGDFNDDGSQPPGIDTTGTNPGDMPGIPGTATQDHGTDNYALEILTVVNFPSAGLYTMNVNSDDGFRIVGGNPQDTFYQVLGEYNGGKGTSQQPRYIRVMQPGLYPLRMVYEEGGGGDSVEWSMINNNNSFTDGVGTLNNGSVSLINNTADTAALKSYQYPITSKGAPYVKSFQPARGGAWSSAGGYPTLGLQVPGAYYNPSYAPGTSGARPGPDTPIKAVLEDGETAVDTSTVKLALDGVSVTPTVTKTGTETTVLYQPATQFAVGSRHTVDLTFLDRTLSWYFEVGPIPTPTFFIEAADFNYNGGQTKPEASVMPYIGGAYAGLSGTTNIDMVSSGDTDNPWYRYPATQTVPMSMANDRDRGLGEVQCHFRLGWIGGGQWYNYTRTFPAGTYNVYAALSNGGSDPGGCHGTLQQVADATVANQTLTQLGVFDAKGSGEWGRNSLVPLRDAATTNTLVALPLSGTTTLRYTPTAGDWDYMIFVPAGGTVTGPKITQVGIASGNINITWTGGGTLQNSTDLKTWADITGATTGTYSTAASAAHAFYRVRQ